MYSTNKYNVCMALKISYKKVRPNIHLKIICAGHKNKIKHKK